MSPWTPDSLWIEASEIETEVARRVRSRLPGLPVHVVEDPRTAETADFAEGKRRLVVQRHRGSFLQACPAGTQGLVCCNYLVMNFGSNCPYDCSYCFLQEYLQNNPALKVFTNPQDALVEVEELLRRRPDRSFRIGTGELADSLALDSLTDLSLELVGFFARQPNAVLELKTKSVAIDNLLRIDPAGQTVVSWSVNAPLIASTEEPGTPSLAERLQAARAVAAAGYRVGFHFDPLVPFEGWEESYREAVEAVAAAVPADRVAWISLGSLRVSPGLRRRIRTRPEPSRILLGEIVPGADGKERPWQGLRVRMYRKMLGWLRDVDPKLPLYICMEPAPVWERTMGTVPSDREVAEQLVAATR